MRYSLFLIILSFTFGSRIFAQTNSSCGGAAPFCSSSASQYPASTGAGNLPAGTYIGCLGSAPNPAFFTIPVTQTGSLSMVISAASDIDFITFGPFPTAGGNCNSLTAANQVPNSPNLFTSPTNTSNGCSYSGSNTETLVIPNAVAGEFYILLITNFSNQPQQITVNPSGSSGAIGGMSVTGTSSVCAGQTGSATVLAGSSIQSVLWQDPTGVIGSGFSQTFNNLQSTTLYTIVGMSATGQSCTATHQIVVKPTPVPIITNNSPICVGENAILSVTGGTAYSWSGPNFYSQNSSATSSLAPSSVTLSTAQLSNTGTYSVVATLNTCTAATSSYMLVKPNPTVTVARGGDFCFGKSFNLTANGANTFTWTGPNGFYFQGQNPLFLNNSFSMAGTYTVLGKSNGCTGGGGLNVTIFPLPNITASSSGSICQNASLTLSAAGGSTYVWSGPGLFTSHQGTVSIHSGIVANTGMYTVIGKDLNGCVNTATIYQTVRPNPFVNIDSKPTCITKNLLLTADGGTYYKWSGPANFSSNDQNPVIPNASPLNTGVYNTTVTTAYGCASTASIQGIVNLNPDIEVLGSREVCRGRNFAFTATGANDYKWLNSTGIMTQLPTFTINSASPSLQRTYTLVAMDGNACISYKPFYPIVNELPVAQIIPEVAKSCAPFCTTIDLNVLSTNVTAYEWKSSDGASTVGQTNHYTKCFPTTGITTLSVTLTDAKTCTSVVTRTIEALTSPIADFTHTPDKPTPSDNVVTFVDTSSNTDVVSWSWDFYLDERGSKKDTSVKNSATLTYKEVGNYVVYLKVTGANGCTDSTTKLLVLAEDPSFFVPNAFTPNGDGLNDIFIPKSVAVSLYEMQIFNRWGKLVFSTTDPSKGWDGKANGGDVAPADVYTYKFTVTGYDKNPKLYTGQFSLIK